MPRLIQALLGLRYSLWLVPSAIILFAVALALFAVDADTRIDAATLAQWPRFFGASADGVRSVLQVIAGAMITVGTLTFSITMLVLSSAAQQYTPRVIRTFMRSRTTQAVLGTFLGIFVYCLVVLRTVHGSGDKFVPSISVTLAIVLALLGVGILVYFIHHLARSIQASTIIFTIAKDTLAVIDASFERGDDAEAADAPASAPRTSWHALNGNTTGYLGTIDMRVLSAYAKRHRLTLRLERQVGDFVVAGMPLAQASRPLAEDCERQLNKAFVVGHFRTVEQDASVGIQQLVDIALKAMSPAVNDTTTALLCIDYLSAIVVRLGQCTLRATPATPDAERVLTVGGPRFSDFLARAFQQIRQNAGGNFAVYAHLLQSLARIAGATGGTRRRQAIRREIELVWDYAQHELHRPDQLADIVSRINQGLAAPHPGSG